ncbi:MAG: 1,4-alpha-glucan branching protein GlgB [Ruminococcaceae bacterium]|nr:1,4-alpha-glucan branching protein GlgB [Oscillospiraceae bacterium]
MKQKQELAPYLFHQGTNYMAYEYLGVHRTEDGYVFRVWAPNAEAVSVIGDFNYWAEGDAMTRITEGGIWEATLSADRVREGQPYKYRVIGNGKTQEKADPYGIRTECPPKTATVVSTVDGYEWRDSGWLAHRKKKADRMYSEPMNVYELHLGSWKRHADGSYYSYGELAAELAPYVKQMGYTHVELMPVMEHPFDGSWGYQVCSYYAPTARFGSPQEFMGFVDSMHEAGIGVILDWVPAHFPKDEHGLYEFDGRPVYEYQGADRMEHAGWGTRRFDVGRNEVQSFLVSNAIFWFERYHVDGLRVDAVASMIYLDYDKKPGEWVPNIYGDHRCLEAIAFFRKLNGCIKEWYPDVLMIAEESTAWANVTTFDQEGLGFDMKWNMGWMNDTLSYAAMDPIYRKYHHEKMTFSLTYAFSERYVLPISHDEVVHGKRSFLDKMSGDYWQKFAGARAFMGYMMTHPGKKLTFMGNEMGQFREWDYAGQIEWFLLDYEAHAKLQHYAAELNQLYLATPPLWQIDDSWEGFRWIDADNREQSILSYRRIDRKGKEVIVLINFTPVAREEFLLGVPVSGVYEEIFNSDREEFGGSGVINTGELRCTGQPWNWLADSIRLRVPPLGMTMVRCKRKYAARSGKEARTS